MNERPGVRAGSLASVLLVTVAVAGVASVVWHRGADGSIPAALGGLFGVLVLALFPMWWIARAMWLPFFMAAAIVAETAAICVAVVVGPYDGVAATFVWMAAVGGFLVERALLVRVRRLPGWQEAPTEGIGFFDKGWWRGRPPR